MSQASEQLAAISFRGVQVLALTEAGLPAATGTTEYAGLRVTGAKALTLERPEWETLYATGDDTVLAAFRLPPQETERGELRVGAFDMTAEALVSGAKVVAQGEGNWLPSGLNRTTLPRVCLLAWREAKSVAAGDADRPHYQAVLIPSATLSPMGGSFDERAVGDRSLRVACNVVSKWPWGKALAEEDEGGTTLQSADGAFEYVPRLCAFKGDGTAVEFTFGVEAVHTDKVSVYQVTALGVFTDITESATLTIATTKLTFDTAPADGTLIIVVMEVAA